MSQVPRGSHVCTEYARTLIRVKARQIVCRPGFSRSDTGDVEQDLYLHLLSQAQQFDPTRGSINTFIARVVDSAVAMLVSADRVGTSAWVQVLPSGELRMWPRSPTAK